MQYKRINLTWGEGYELKPIYSKPAAYVYNSNNFYSFTRALLTIEDALEKSKPQQNLNSSGQAILLCYRLGVQREME